MNLVGRFFAELTQEQIRRGVHRSTGELETAIRDYLRVYKLNPKPLVWTKTGDLMTVQPNLTPLAPGILGTSLVR